MSSRLYLATACAALLAPLIASAATDQENLVSIVNIFNMFAGVMFVAAVLLFGAGLTEWLANLGTPLREGGIERMEWGVMVLFTLVVVEGIVRFVEYHTQSALYVVGLVIIIVVAKMAIDSFSGGEAPKADGKHS